MTRAPMSPAPQGGQPERKEKTAAALFAGFMTLALGSAGLLIAALAVGLERSVAGGAVERGRARQRGQGWLANQRAWLDADHQRRTATADTRRRWLEAGADPTTEPARPSTASKAGNALRRLLANVAVAGSDFRDGFRDGWKAADDKRKAGGSFREITHARPGGSGTDTPDERVCGTCRRPAVPVTGNGLCGDCEAVFKPQPDPAAAGTGRPAGSKPSPRPHIGVPSTAGTVTDGRTPAVLGDDQADRLRSVLNGTGPDITRGACPVCGAFGNLTIFGCCEPCVQQAGHALCGQCRNPMIRDGGVYRHSRHQQCTAVAPVGNEISRPRTEGAGTLTTEGEPMKDLDEMVGDSNDRLEQERERINNLGPGRHSLNTPLEQSGGNRRSGPGGTGAGGTGAGESNASVLRGKLTGIKQDLHQMAELTDQLAKVREQMAAKVRESDEFAQATGQSNQARQALDEASAVAAAMGQHLGSFSEGAVSAEEQMGAASDGLRVAENAEDELRSAGADGRAVAPAGAGA
ncbi:hypothetical protein [Actinoplanes sp. URMC 104]|uniref:hypothetical protein n=1 Tax=Actinoplanes sp. URMC 104 TaxID=3423409 RepID=UPI003F1AB162